MSDTSYNVVYSKMGKTIKEPFPTLDEAIQDFKEKSRLDRLGYFDDRFVIGIEDYKGNKIDISNTDVEKEKRKAVAIITARGGSKRIPGKNIKEFFSKPILAYSIEAAVKSGLFDEVMVSTDDEEIAKVARKYGAEIPFMRSKETANDYAGLADVVEEVRNEYQKRGVIFEFICCILPTAPLIKIENLKKGFELLVEKNTDIIIPIVKFSYPIQRAFKKVDGKIEMFYPEFYSSRSQDLEPAYHDAGQFYWMKFDNGLKGENRYGLELTEIQVQDIDTDEDWNLAELKYKLLNE